ncbi:MAG: SDR family NAD(P)-dependent oxidoreductase [Cyanobacteria bacterium J06635_15]
MSEFEEHDYLDKVAIIGMAGHFPGAKNLDEFWLNLRSGVESVSFFSDQELRAIGVNPALLNDPNYVKAGILLEDKDLFDAAFFGYSPRQAEIIDPQQRLFLECAWNALESAGYEPQAYPERINVYGGAGINSYLFFNLASNPGLAQSVGFTQIRHSNRQDNLATRVAYKLNLKGSALTVQTGCSTSLVAVHLACQSLLDHECHMALAGGVRIGSLEQSGYLYQEGGIASPDGHCRTFDAMAKGTIGGEGVGIVVLKRLEDAIADGDTIHAVIRGSATNNDGSDKVGYTAPSVNGQAAVIAEALAMGRSEAETVSYVEAHGTGTVLGDPIEIAALTEAFRTTTDKKGFCAIGSVKTNIGHLDTAAGIAGLIKTVLALKHKQIPPSLHFKAPNPKIDFANSPFYVNAALSQWQTNGTPRRAGVSSFGIGGTNAHVILEEAPVLEPSSHSRPWQLLVLSAKTASALETATANLAGHCQRHPDLNLADAAHTLQIGRQAFNHRRMAVVQDLDDAVQVLEAKDLQRVFTRCHEPANRQVTFMFPGQGAQYVNMGRELYQTEPIFREQVDHCCELLKSQLNVDLRTILYPSQEQMEAATQQLKQTRLTQPALFVVEYALAQLWLAWGMSPQAMIGHSIGEYVAACLSGVFCLEDALALVATRGQLMQQLPEGAMLAVPLSQQALEPLLDEKLSLATANAPESCVVSGPIEAIHGFQERLTHQGLECRRLHTSHAFHSQMMDSIMEPFKGQFSQVTLNPPKIPFVSNVTGAWITAAQATDPTYWAMHLRQTVRFSEGIAELLQAPERIFLEVGPGRTLSTLTRKQKRQEQVVVSSLRHPQDPSSDVEVLLNALGKLWLEGIQIDWSGFYTHEQRHRIPLPTYSFERKKYWIQAQPGFTPVTKNRERLRKKPNITDWFYVPVWKRSRLLEPFENTETSEQSSCWLVFIDECGIGSLIVKRLQKNGQSVISVKTGERFAKVNDQAYVINPQQRDDYEALLHAISLLNEVPKTIIHLWGITTGAQDVENVEGFETSQYLGFYSLLWLAQALGKQAVTDALQIAVVANTIFDVIGNEPLHPTKATVLGPCKVIPREYPNINCQTIDIAIPASATQFHEKLADQILGEIRPGATDSLVAYRGYHRWVQSFEALPLKEVVPGKPRLRQGGVYLITGGLGGIGLTLAEYLAQTVQAKLVLLGRKGLPERDEWSEWLANHDESHDVSRKILKVQALEALGAEVLVIAADVTNLEKMRDAIAWVNEHFGKVHGVIHNAGVAGGGTIQLKMPQVAASVLAAKVQGTLVLDTLFKKSQLDFLVLSSALSSGSILGRFGQVDYCGANAFLDAFAHQKSSTSKLLTIAINWKAWQEVGMAVNTPISDERRKKRQESLKEGIAPKEGIEAFSRILQSGLPQVVVSPGDLQTQIEKRNLFDVTEEALASADIPQVLHSRPSLGNDYVPARNEVEQIITNTWQQILGIEQIGIHDNFFELGGDSVISIQIVSILKKQLNIDIPVVRIYERPTISSLTEILSSSDTNESDRFAQNKSRGEERRQKRKRNLRS